MWGDRCRQRYCAARLVALPLTPHKPVATPRRETVLEEDGPSSHGDGYTFCRAMAMAMARDGGFLRSKPGVILITMRLGRAVTLLLRASLGAC